MTRTVEFYVSHATEKFEAGFTSKAAQKDAVSFLGDAARLLYKEIQKICWSLRTDANDCKTAPERADKAYWLNFDLHLWNAKRRAALLDLLPEAEAVANQFDDLAALRAQIVKAEIVKAERKASAEVERVQVTIREMMEKRQAQYARGLELHDIFNGLGVTANVHLVTNQHGTTFLRAFYFMHGVMTPLNIIIAVAQTKAREAEGK